MAAQLIDGNALAAEIRESIRARAQHLRAIGRTVRLDAVLAAGKKDAASRVYAQNQARMCEDLAIDYHLHELHDNPVYDDIAGRVLLLNADPDVHAIMVHLPLPAGIDTYRIQSLIDPDKDVEGVNPANIGNIVYGRSSLAPCTALAAIRMIEHTGIDLKGKFAVCIGASDIVGKPAAVMLMRKEATVLSCNEFTENITDYTRAADVLIAAAGVPGLVKADWVKPGAVIIDVGISRVDDPDNPGKQMTVGDVAFDEVRQTASWLTPVPGGVGPVTVAMLLENVIASASHT